MPDRKIKAQIVFENGDKQFVMSTVEEIRTLMSGETEAQFPLLKVVDQNGADLWIGAAHIREIRTYPP
jgi:uncharacterized protein YlzI (FlbEa/FlbD family)